MRNLCVLILILFVKNAYAQNNPKAVIKAVLEQSYATEKKAVDKKALLKNVSESIILIENSLTDTLGLARADLYATLNYLQTNSPENNSIFLMYIKGLKDKNASAVKNCVQGLQKFGKAFFTPTEITIIAGQIKSKQPSLGNLAKLLSFIGDSTHLKTLESIKLDPYLPPQDKQDLNYAFIRLGDKELKAKLIRRLITKPINDDVVSYALPDLLFTRQKDIYDVFVKELASESKNCESPSTSSMISCGFSIMESFIPYIANYPLKYDKLGDLDLTDDDKAYEMALKNIIEWFKANPDYVILKDKY